MRLAFPTRTEQTITQHFGRMKSLVIIDVADGVEASREVRDMSGLGSCGGGQGGKTQFLAEKLADCDVLIAGGMGSPMFQKASDAGVEVVLTTVGPIDEARDRYLAGSLDHQPELAHDH